MTDQPRTAAGRALLADLAYTRDNYLDPILAIEAEAGGEAIRESQLASRIEAESAEPAPSRGSSTTEQPHDAAAPRGDTSQADPGGTPGHGYPADPAEAGTHCPTCGAAR